MKSLVKIYANACICIYFKRAENFGPTAIPLTEWKKNHLGISTSNPIKDSDSYDPDNAWDQLSAYVYDITHI